MIDTQSLSEQAEINRIETKETAHKLAGIDNVGLDLSEIPPPQWKIMHKYLFIEIVTLMILL